MSIVCLSSVMSSARFLKWFEICREACLVPYSGVLFWLLAQFLGFTTLVSVQAKMFKMVLFTWLMPELGLLEQLGIADDFPLFIESICMASLD